MADEVNKDTGKYIELLNICANKENLDGSVNEDASGMKTQFTAEEFNGIVIALKELYNTVSEKQTYLNQIVDYETSATASRSITAKAGNPVSLKFQFISKWRQGFNDWQIIESDRANFTIKYMKLGSLDYTTIYDSKTAGEGGTELPITSKKDIFEFDITNYISGGGKYEFIVEATNLTNHEVEGYSPNCRFVYNVIITDMSLEFATSDWWKSAFIYDPNNTQIPINFKVGGSGNRRVIVETVANGVTTYWPAEGTPVESGNNTIVVYVTNPSKSRSTVMSVKAWMVNADDTTVQTDPIEAQIMCIRPNATSAQVVMATSNFVSTIKSGKQEVLFDYAVYDSSTTTGTTDVVFKIRIEKDGEIVNDEIRRTVALDTIHSLVYDLGNISANQETFYMYVRAERSNGARLFSERAITVDNRSNYSPVAGAVWYLNPAGRENTEANAQEIKNSIDNTFVTAEWENFSWSTNDAWCKETKVDSVSGESYTLSSLRVPAGSKVNINYQPLSVVSSAARDEKTIEIDYLIKNVSDYTLPVIQMMMERATSWVGIKIFPGKISTATSSVAENIQSQIATDDGVRIRAVISVNRGISHVTGASSNFVKIFIDGILAKEYEITEGDSMSTTTGGNIVIGSAGCDVEVYGIRVYNSSLTNVGVTKNYISRLNTDAEKEAAVADNRVFGNDSSSWLGDEQVNFANTADQYNVFVYDGEQWPSYLTGDIKSYGNLELYSINNVGGKKGNSWKIAGVRATGQGTTSMSYWEWNLQFKTGYAGDNHKGDSDYWPIVFDEQTRTWSEDESQKVEGSNKIPMFEGVPKASAIVMKKNWASSMQDHKIGSVNSFTDVWKALGFSNAASTEDPEVRVSVYQEPMLGFHKKTTITGEVIYEYKGLFTGGPHKGDKQCFGYDDEKWPDLISIEGSDNGAPFANFQVPWKIGSQHVTYVATSDIEAFQYDGVTSWDFNFGCADSDDETAVGKILDQFNRTFHNPYNIAYECSQSIAPFEGTYEELLTAVENKQLPGSVEYWTTDYNLYHVFGTTVEAVDTGNGHLNLLTQLSDYICDWEYTVVAGSRTFVEGTTKVSDAIASATTASEKNEIFKKARAYKFRTEASKWWDIEDSIFQHCWMEFFAGTDQRAKNSYPYSYQTKDEDGNLTQDGKWKWRLDDADTIGPIDNGGTISKEYYVEVHDKKSNGSYYWNGEGNVFFNLIEVAFTDKYYSIMKRLLDAMVSLSGINEGTGSSKIYGFYDKYFLAVKRYFPEVMYNNDSVRYETAYQQKLLGVYSNSISPLNQSLGNGYSPETAWYKKRIQYITSKYAFGDYALNAVGNTFQARISTSDTDTSLDLTFTPNLSHYPVIEFGTSVLAHSVRCEEGVPHEFNLNLSSSGTGDQMLYIHGASQFSDLGDLHKMRLNSGYTPDFSVFTSAKELNLGYEVAEEVAHAAETISVPKSANKLYLENYSALTAISNLSDCTRLKDINAVNTNVTRFNFANGAPLTSVKFPSTVQNLTFLNCKYLEEKNIKFNGKDNIELINIVNSPGVPGVLMIKDVIEAQRKLSNRVLRYINVTDVNETYTGTESAEVLELLGDITKEGSGYYGVNEGSGDEKKKPLISGTIGIQYAYEDTKTALENYFDGQLKINVDDYYIRFADSLVEDKMKELMVSWGYIEEGDTITMSDATKVTKLSKAISSGGGSTTDSGISIFIPTKINSFDELKYFTNYTTVNFAYDNSKPKGDFYEQDKLTSISLDNITEIKVAGFAKCSSLTSINLPKLRVLGGGSTNYYYSEWGAFAFCSSLKEVISLGTISSIPPGTFEECSKLEKINIPNTVSTIGQYAFTGCKSLVEIVIPSSVGSIGDNAFTNTNLLSVYWNTTGATVSDASSFGPNVGPNGELKIYVPKKFYDGVQAGSYGGGWTDLKSNLVAYDFDKNTVL